MNDLINQSELLTIKEVSCILNVSPASVRRILKSGQLKRIVVNNRSVRISAESIQEYKDLLKFRSGIEFKKILTIDSKNNNFGIVSDFPGGDVRKKIKSWGGRGNYYFIRKQYKGQQYVVYKGRDRKEAERKLAEFELKIMAGPSALSFNSFFEKQKDVFFKGYALRYIEEVTEPFHRTGKTDKKRYNAIVKFFEPYRIQDIDYSSIKKYIAYRRNQYSKSTWNDDGSRKYISNATINREISFISAVLREALRDEIISRHPLTGIKLKLEEGQKEIHPVESYEKLNKFTNSFPQKLQPLIKFASLSGFRLNTVLNLRKDSYNRDTKEIIILKQFAKNKKTQIFPLSDEAVEILDNIKNDSPYFFLSQRTGRPYNDIRGSFKSAVRKAGLHSKTTFHDLRRTFGTNLLRMGYPLKMISRAMGHSSIVVTERYLRISEEKDLKPMIRELGKKVGKDGKKVATKVATLEEYRRTKYKVNYN